MSNEEITNIAAALDKELSTGMGVSQEISTEEGAASKNILVRLPESDRTRWKQAADKMGLTVSQLIRDTVNEKVKNILDGPHPVNQRRYYPWSEFCLACETRLR